MDCPWAQGAGAASGNIGRLDAFCQRRGGARRDREQRGVPPTAGAAVWWRIGTGWRRMWISRATLVGRPARDAWWGLRRRGGDRDGGERLPGRPVGLPGSDSDSNGGGWNGLKRPIRRRQCGAAATADQEPDQRGLGCLVGGSPSRRAFGRAGGYVAAAALGSLHRPSRQTVHLWEMMSAATPHCGHCRRYFPSRCGRCSQAWP